jgi:hypothetical protein
MSLMKLDHELKHKSEDIQDAVLMDVVSAIRRRVRVVNRNYDIPYIAGYSQGRPYGVHRPAPAADIPLAHEDGASRTCSHDARNRREGAAR